MIARRSVKMAFILNTPPHYEICRFEAKKSVAPKPVKVNQISHERFLSVIISQSYIQNIIHEENAMELRIIHGHFVMDFQFNANPSLFLSNNLCYLRLDSKNIQNNVTLLNINIAKKMCRCFFEEIWSHSEEDVVISDWRKIESILKHMKQSVALLKKVDKEI